MASAMEHYQNSESAIASSGMTTNPAIAERQLGVAEVHALLAVAGALLEAKGATGDDTAPNA
jgi:hypothetical protein